MKNKIKNFDKIKSSIADDSKKNEKNIFNSIADPILIIDKEHNILDVNSTFLSLVGRNKNRLIGKKCYEIVHGTYKPIEGCPTCKLLEIGNKETCEIYHPGLKKHLLVSSSPILEKGSIKRIVHHIKDISEVKKTEEKYRSIVESSLEGIWQIDNKGITTYASHRMSEILGYSVNEMLGKNFMEFMDKKAKEEAIKLEKQIKKEQKAFKKKKK